MTSDIQSKLRIDERFSWSFVGVILAVLFGAFSLYSIFHENRPNLVFEIESQSDVFDLHRPLRDLSLSFRGQDVQQQNLNVRILTVRVWNKGGVDILQGHYDQQEAWGFKVEPGQVIEVRVGSNNSQYLATHIEPQITADNLVTLNKVIFERDKFVSLEVLVLHHKDSPPRIIPFGKIAGLNDIVVVDSSSQGVKPTFWHQAIYGSPLIHVVRFVGYVVVLILTIIAIVGATSMFSGLGKSRRRRRIGRLFTPTAENAEVFELVKEHYANFGVDGLKVLANVIKDQKLLQRYLDIVANKQKFDARREAARAGRSASSTLSNDEIRRIQEMHEREIVIGSPAFAELLRAGKIKATSPDNGTDNNEIIQMLDSLSRRLEDGH